MTNKKIFLWLLKVFLIWRLVLFLAAFLGIQYLPINWNFVAGKRAALIKGETIIWQEAPLLYSWANFDGVHYLRIAYEGYHTTHYAFFPFYPLLIRFFAPLFNNQFIWAGFLIGNLSFLAALFFLFKICQLDFSEKVAKKTIIALLVFPASFFFGSVYSESLFLLIILASFYSAMKGKWWLAGFLGALASATRLVGIFLLPALLLELWHQKKYKKNLSFVICHLSLMLIPLGLLFYMAYLNKAVGDPLYFLHVLPKFGTGRTGGRIILAYQVAWRYFKIFWTVPWREYNFKIALLEFMSTLSFGSLLLWAWLKKIGRQSSLIFSFLSLITPTLTGTLTSMPRYLLTCFPCFILIGLIKNRKILFSLYLFFFILLIICSMLFTRGYWIS